MTTFHTTRRFDAPPSAVFAAMQDGKRLARWWGPSGFTNQFDVFEFRPGGQWVFTMTGPDGKTYPNESVFTTIEPDHKVVIRHVCQPIFELSIVLETAAGGTLLHWTQTFADPAVAASVRHIVEPANEQNLDRLGVELGAT